MNLETITNILVDNAKKFRNKTLDMSMFEKAEIPRIYAAAAEGTLKNRDFDSTGSYLYLGKQWERLLELGTPFLHSEDVSEQEAGKNFLTILAHHAKLPKDTAIELADHILKNDGKYSRHQAVAALAAGNAKERASQEAYKFFNEGEIEDGERFLEVSGKKLTNDEVVRFAEIALKKENYKDAFKLYESRSLSIPIDQAKTIANGDVGGWLFDNVVSYMDKNKDTFATKEFKEFADAIFEAGNHDSALKIYERAGKLVSSDDYNSRGEQILGQVREIESNRTSYTFGSVWPSIKTAFEYLSKKNPKEAKQRIAQYADSLLDQPDLARASSNTEAFWKIYEMIGTPIPFNRALKAGQLSEKKQKYDEAAKFYATAGMNDAAKRMGDLALRSDNDWQREYGSREAFEAAGDKDGLAVAQFIEKNLRKY